MRTISRDPFARLNVVSESVPTHASCHFCGQHRYRAGKKVNALFKYGTDPDSGRIHFADHLFCSLGCYKAYYGI